MQGCYNCAMFYIFTTTAMDGRQIEIERMRILITGVVIDLAVTDDSHPLLAVHLDRLAALLTTQTKVRPIFVDIDG